MVLPYLIVRDKNRNMNWTRNVGSKQAYLILGFIASNLVSNNLKQFDILSL